MTELVPLERLRAVCMALPGATEKLSHGSASWFAKKMFASHTFTDDKDHDGRESVWCAAPPGVQEEMVGQEPDRFYRPPYVGHRGWIGVYLDGAVDWDEVAEVIQEAYRVVAPRKLIAELDAR